MFDTISAIEDKIDEICTRAAPRFWDEDHITYSLLEALRTLFNRRNINYGDWSKTVHWESFKNKGKVETRYGDIALLVNIQFVSGEILKGVAFIEAKRSFKSGNFESLDEGQLARILNNAPYSQLLLYNHNPQEIACKFLPYCKWDSHFYIMPINTAHPFLKSLEDTGNGNNHLLRATFPFTEYLMARVFAGHDLDYRTDVYKTIATKADADMLPGYLAIVNVYYSEQKQVPIEVTLSPNWQKI